MAAPDGIMPNGLLTEDDYQALIAIADSLGVIGTMFHSEEATLPGLRMAVAGIRSAADVLEAVADRWEALDG